MPEGSMSGLFNLTDSTATENTKLEFDVNQDASVNIEYNDKLRVLSSKTALVESLKEVTAIDSGNLLYVYISDYIPLIQSLIGEKVESTNSIEANYDNVMKCLTSLGDAIKIEATTSYVIDLSIDFTKLNLDIMNTDLSTMGSLKCTINLNPTDNKYLQLTLKDINYDGCTGDITASLTTYSDRSSEISFSDSVGQVDLTTLPILTKVGIATTERKAYKMSGSLTAKTTGVVTWFMSVDINASVDVYLSVGDELDENGLYTIKGYITVNNNKENDWSSNTMKTSRSFDSRITKYIIKDTDAYIYQNKHYYEQYKNTILGFPSGSWKDKTNTYTHSYFKTTQKEMVTDILYYLVDFTLGAPDLYTNIVDAMGGSMDLDFFDMFKYLKLIEEGKYQVYLKVLSLMNVYADIYYDKTTFLLDRINAYTNFNILIGSVSFNLDVSNQNIAGVGDIQTQMDDYDAFNAAWISHSETNNLKYRPNKDETGTDYIYTSSTQLF